MLLWRWKAPSEPRSAMAVLSLRVNMGRQATIIAGTPLLFDVSLTARTGGPSAIGDTGNQWSTLIHFAIAGSDRVIPWQVSSLGRPYTMLYESNARNDSAPVEGLAAAAVGPDGQSVASFAVSPTAMQTAKPGTYQIQAVLERGFWPPWAWHGRVVSRPVTVVVENGLAERDTRLQERLILSAHYYLASHQPGEAHKVALELSARDPKDVGALILLGDALVADGSSRDALKAYRSALALLPARYEEPLLLYQRIQDASKKLAK